MADPFIRRVPSWGSRRLRGLSGDSQGTLRGLSGDSQLFAVAYFQYLINYDLILKDAGTPFLGTPFPELKSQAVGRVGEPAARSLPLNPWFFRIRFRISIKALPDSSKPRRRALCYLDQGLPPRVIRNT